MLYLFVFPWLLPRMLSLGLEAQTCSFAPKGQTDARFGPINATGWGAPMLFGRRTASTPAWSSCHRQVVPESSRQPENAGNSLVFLGVHKGNFGQRLYYTRTCSGSLGGLGPRPHVFSDHKIQLEWGPRRLIVRLQWVRLGLHGPHLAVPTALHGRMAKVQKPRSLLAAQSAVDLFCRHPQSEKGIYEGGEW